MNTQIDSSPAPIRASMRKGRVRLSPTIIALAPMLADRHYQSGELAFELKLPDADRWRVREWCRRGLPHTHDPTGHLLVNGREFGAWVTGQSRHRKRQQLPEGHMWCPGCNTPQVPTNITFQKVRNRLLRMGVCPRGHRMSQLTAMRNVI